MEDGWKMSQQHLSDAIGGLDHFADNLPMELESNSKSFCLGFNSHSLVFPARAKAQSFPSVASLSHSSPSCIWKMHEATPTMAGWSSSGFSQLKSKRSITSPRKTHESNKKSHTGLCFSLIGNRRKLYFLAVVVSSTSQSGVKFQLLSLSSWQGTSPELQPMLCQGPLKVGRECSYFDMFILTNVLSMAAW